MSRMFFPAAFCAALAAGAVQADVCDYRLSEIISERAPKLAAAAADATVMARFDPTAPDFLTLVDANTGFTAVGAAVAGARAVKAMSGAAAGAEAVAGAGSAVLTSPVLGMAAGAAALGFAGVETVCRFKSERITDYYEVLAVLAAVAETADRDYFQLQLGPPRKKGAVVEIWDAKSGVRKQYRVADLILSRGELKLTRWGPNKNLGVLMQFEGGVPQVRPAP